MAEPPVRVPRQFVQAAAFAAAKHRDQRRKDAGASPYINHPLEVANVLATDGGVDDENVLCAAVLHDTLEDTQTTPEELERVFGAKVAGIVAEVSDDKSLPKQLRKQLQIDHAPGLSCAAKLVKLADKICNLRDILACPPEHWPATRKQEYFDWAGQVVAGMRGTNRQLEAIFDALLARRSELI